MTDASFGTTQACPACDDTDIRQRLVDKHESRSDPDAPRWVCEDCGHEFDTPIERERHSMGGRPGLAGELARAQDEEELRTDGGLITACPECESASIKRRTPAKPESSGQGYRWYCNACGHHFDEPIERERECEPQLSGVAADLDAADPDAIPDGGSVMTWDHEECPHEDCDGELQQQGDANVMCLSCEDVWGHHKNDEEHYLVSKASNIVARKPRVETDGGRELPTHHSVCRDCPDEWVGGAQGVHRDAEIHSLAHGHRTVVAEVAER